PVPQAGKPEPGRLDQGPHRAVDDRSRRKRRPHQARRPAGGGHCREHRPGTRAGGRAERLSAADRRAGQDEPGEDFSPQGDGRRGAAYPLGCHQGSSRVLPGPGDAEALGVCRDLLRKEGILAGTSSGTLIAAALRYCREQPAPKRVVTLVCDSGNKYLSKVYNDYWMLDQGFIQRERFGDLRDLIARRHREHAVATVNADEAVLNAYQRMKLYDVSQLPVLKDGRIVGILDEEDI